MDESHSNLNIIKGGSQKKLPPRLILEGDAKIGKSTFCAGLPKPIFIPTEDGASSIVDLDRFPVQKNWGGPSDIGLNGQKNIGLLDAIASLGKQEKIPYRSIVIDTLDNAESICKEMVLRINFQDNAMKYKSWGQGDGVLAIEFKLLLDYLDRLRAKHNCMIVLVTHIGSHNVNNPIDGDYTKLAGTLTKNCWGMVKNWSDQIGYATYETRIINADDSERIKGKAIASKTRKIIFAGHAGLDAGCRFGYEMPETIALDSNEYIENLKKIMNCKKSKKGKQND